jgi:hypothetical protein
LAPGELASTGGRTILGGFSGVEGARVMLQYKSPDEYGELIKTLHAFTGIVLYGFLDEKAGLRDRIIRHFIARGQTCLESIEALWRLQHYQDCYALYRGLLDRVFHLHALVRDDTFEQFDDWSFIKQFRTANYARCHPDFREKPGVHDFTAAEKERYRVLSRGHAPKWRKVDPKSAAKEMDLEFLYHLGYSYASQHVHPMANDGQEDFERITLLRTEPMFDQRSVLHNAVVVYLLLIQNGLNAGNAKWRQLIYSFLSDCMDFLATGQLRYLVTFLKIGNQGPQVTWSEWGTT